jgi:hypothetical protein
MLWPRIVAHLTKSKHATTPGQEPYNFRANHRRLSEALRYVFNFIDAKTISRTTSPDGPGSEASQLLLDLVLEAMSIVVLEASIDKIALTDDDAGAPGREAPGVGDSEYITARTVALQCCLEIGRGAPVAGQVMHDPAAAVAISWAVYVALRSLLRRQGQNRHLACQSGMLAKDSHATTIPYFLTGDTIPALKKPDCTCSASPGPGDVEPGPVVADLSEALISNLAGWSRRYPISAFFLDQITADYNHASEGFDDRIVGLVSFV